MSFIPLSNDSNKIYSPDPSILKQAMGGDPMAQFELGELYFYASYSEENYLNAFRWIYCSAEQGNVHAQFKLGDLYALGKGTCQSYTDAYKWYTKAAIRGYKKALIRIHNLYQEDIRVHCRGKLTSKERDHFGFRELNEKRLSDQILILNHANNYYITQFKKYKSSNLEDAEVQQHLGFHYQHGYGVKRYTSVAMRYYTLAAEQGFVDAQYNLGFLYQKSTDIKFNYRKAFYWYSLSAKGGNIAAQNCLGYFYEKGLSTDIDYQKALYWYTKAANAGYSEAQVTLGKWYRKGQYVSQDYIQATHWYKIAARQGNQVAQNCLDLLYQTGNISDAIDEEEISIYSTESSRKKRLCSRLRLDIDKLNSSVQKSQLEKVATNALKGDGNAMYTIGQMYHSGETFVKDKDIGFKWICNAANSGNKVAQFKVAKMYENGDTIEQNYHKTSIWIKKLAKKKDDVAQYRLGILYKKGLGVRNDPLESSKWIILSRDQGNVDAMREFGHLKEKGIVYKQDHQEAMKWYYESAIRGSLNSCYKLGEMYLEGTVTKEHANKGIRILIHAAKHGHTGSQYELGKIYKTGEIVQQDFQRSSEYYSMINGSLDEENLINIIQIYLCRSPIFEKNIKACALFKKIAGRNYSRLIEIFGRLTKYYDLNLDLPRLITLYRYVLKAGIAYIDFNIGSIYEHGKYNLISEEIIAVDFNSAMHWYTISASKGDSRADYRLGIMYELGKGVTKDMTTAVEHYKQAAYNNNNDAKYRLACFHLAGHTLPKNVARAYYLFTEASNLGHKESRNALMLSDNTKGEDSRVDDLVPEVLTILNEENQINMLETMAESGLLAVQYQLGKMYQDNNDSKAIKWFTLAAQGGISDACYRLGVFYEEGRGVHQSYSIAKDLYEKAAQGDHEDAIYRLAQMYQFGKETQIRYIEAYYLYLRASQMGHELSFRTLNILGDLYKTSSGTTIKNEFDTSSEEYSQTLLMCEYVAEQGNVDLQFKLGVVYESRLRDPNYSKAFKWYQIASLGYHREAIYRLGLLYEKSLGVSKNYHQATELFEQASNLGNSDAIYRLAVAYQYGHGVEADTKKSVEYYTLAAQLHNPLSQHALGILYGTGTLVEKNTLESLKWYTRAYLQGHDITWSNLSNMYDDTPYEKFFYKKLVYILQQISTMAPDRHTQEVYYNSLNKLGCYYYQEKQREKAWEYFEKPLSRNFRGFFHSFLICNFINSKEKNDILNQLKLDKQLMDRLKGNTLYKLGVAYFIGLVEESNHGKLTKKEQQNTLTGSKDVNDALDTIIKQDYSNALFFFKKAAEKDLGKAQYQLGAMYHHGYGVDANIQEATEWHTKAAKNGEVGSLEYLGILYHCDGEMQNFSKAIKYYKMDRGLNAYIGLLYHYGIGIEQSYEKALEYYQRGRYHLQFQLFYIGLIYYDAHYSRPDYEKAFRLFQSTVEEIPRNENFILVRPSIIGNFDGTANKYTYTLESENTFRGEAYYYLGVMYKNGQGTLQDDQKATHCFLKAVKHGNEQAKQYIK